MGEWVRHEARKQSMRKLIKLRSILKKSIKWKWKRWYCPFQIRLLASESEKENEGISLSCFKSLDNKSYIIADTIRLKHTATTHFATMKQMLAFVINITFEINILLYLNDDVHQEMKTEEEEATAINAGH